MFLNTTNHVLQWQYVNGKYSSNNRVARWLSPSLQSPSSAIWSSGAAVLGFSATSVNWCVSMAFLSQITELYNINTSDGVFPSNFSLWKFSSSKSIMYRASSILFSDKRRSKVSETSLIWASNSLGWGESMQAGSSIIDSTVSSDKNSRLMPSTSSFTSFFWGQNMVFQFHKFILNTFYFFQYSAYVNSIPPKIWEFFIVVSV